MKFLVGLASAAVVIILCFVLLSHRSGQGESILDDASHEPAQSFVRHSPANRDEKASFKNIRDTEDKLDALTPVKIRPEAKSKQDISDIELLEEARKLVMKDAKKEALDIYSSLITNTTNSATLRMALAKYFILNRDMGVLDEALAEMEGELAANPDSIRLMKILAYMYQYAPLPEEEITLREEISRRTTDIENLKRLAVLYEGRSDSIPLAVTYARLAEADPDGGYVYLLKKVETEIAAERFKDAKSTCAQILASKGLSLPVRAHTAVLLGSLDEHQQALGLLGSCVAVAQSTAERERYLLETYRIKINLGRKEPAVLEGLVHLSKNASASGVRRGASNLLAESNQ